MLKRLVHGLVVGLVLGALAAAALVKGLGLRTFDGPLVAYLAAVVTGILTGLVTGKAIWSADGKIEAGLKAGFGALLAAGALFALRKFVDVPLDLTALQLGAGQVGDLPVVALPAIAGVLGAFYEIDNTPAPEADAERGAKAAGGGRAGAKVRVASASPVDDAADDEAAARPRTSKRR